MKKLLALAGMLFALAAVNARIDSTRTCYCQQDCWCKQPGLRHFRWLLPFGHREGLPEDRHAR